jgi:hypothetical protein
MALPALLIPLFSGLAGSIGGVVAKTLSVETIKFLAMRALIMFTVFVALPVVMYNVGVDLIFSLIEAGMDYAGTLDADSLTIQLTGMAGWIAEQIRLPECMSIYMTAISTKFAMGFVPFLR